MKDEGKKRRMKDEGGRMNGKNRTDRAGNASKDERELHPSSFILHPSAPPSLLHPSCRVEVVAAVILNERGQFLLAQRPAGKVYAGYWEFPGGKIERGESAQAALERELQEELGIEVVTAYPWLTRDFDYAHAAVRLRFYRVTQWSGTLHGRELQKVSWQSVDDIAVGPVLPANGPVLRALSMPPVYAITCAHELGQHLQLERIELALRQGLRLIQVREKQYAPNELLAYTTQVVKLAHAFGARVLLNGQTDVAARAGADGVHLSAAHLMELTRRPQCDWCGASCHNEAELERARELEIDFVVLGPVMPTPSHPFSAALGWRRCAQLIANYPLPVFALGGMRAPDLAQAWRCGAHGIAMMRAAWTG